MQRNYPHICFSSHWELDQLNYQLGQCRAMVEAISEVPLRPMTHNDLLRISLIKGAQATTAIEGNTLTEEEIEQVQAGGKLPVSKQYQQTEVENVIGAMNGILEDVTVSGITAAIDPELVKRLHGHVGKNLGEHFDAIPGQYRTDDRRVGPYRCPNPQDVEELTQSLCDWLRRDFGSDKGKQRFRDAVIEAIVAHVYIEWIHPFGDGNGRTGRLLEFYILLRAGLPNIASHILSNFYNETRTEYYSHLQRAKLECDLTMFLAYAVQGLLDGLRHVLDQVQKSQFATAWRSFVYDQFAEVTFYHKNVFKRRRRLALQMPIEQSLSLEEIPRINTEIARSYGALTNRTVRRDLAALIELGLVRRNERKYIANTRQLRSHMPLTSAPVWLRRSAA